MKLLQMSVQAGLMTLAVLFLRSFALHRLPKNCFLALWGLVLLRLLVPFSISSQLSVYQLLPNGAEPIPAAAQVNPLPPAARSVEAAGTVARIGAEESVVSPLLILWLIGALLCAAAFSCSIFMSCRRLRTAVPVEDERVLRWAAEHRRLAILQTDQVDTPVAAGLFRPRIILPKALGADRPELLDYVLTHEYCHLRRLDMLWKLLALCAVCIHWFNPLVWLMRTMLGRDLELCCDEMALRRLGGDRRKDYANSLIEMAEIRSRLSPLQNGFGNNAIEERIVGIMKLKKATKPAICAGCLAILSITAALATNPTANGVETAFSENRASQELYAAYTPYGLTLDGGKLYYDGQLVRRFDDRFPAKNLSTRAIGYYEEGGTVDLRAKREGDKLIGLEVLSEFPSLPQPDNARKDASDRYAVYAPFGLTADEGNLYYDGQRVRLFWDSRSADFSPSDKRPFADSLSNWDAGGVVDLYALRDHDRPGRDGYGTLTGLRVATAEEFSANTERFAGREAAEFAAVEELPVSGQTAATGNVEEGASLDGGFSDPLGGAGKVAMGYGSRVHPITGISYMHYGVDLAAGDGAPVCAAKDGTVTGAAYSESSGYYVTIDHGGGYTSTYAHLLEYAVSAGEAVCQGQRIGAVGQSGWATGPHLHFEIRRDGNSVDPLEIITST